jgi:hypothetical protein
MIEYARASRIIDLLEAKNVGIAQIPGFGPRKCHDSFDFVFPNQSCRTIPSH